MTRLRRSLVVFSIAALVSATVALTPADAHATVDEGSDAPFLATGLVAALLAASSVGLDVWTGMEMAEGEGVGTGLRATTGIVGGVAMLGGGIAISLAAAAPGYEDGWQLWLPGGIAVASGLVGIVLAAVADGPEDVTNETAMVAPWIAPAVDSAGQVSGWHAGAQLRVIDW